jgi:predicted chitinase
MILALTACSGEVGDAGSSGDRSTTGSGGSAGAGAGGSSTGSTTGPSGSSSTATSGSTGASGANGSGGGIDAGMGAGGARADASMPRDSGGRDVEGGGAVVIDAAAGCGIANVVSQTMFDAIFPLGSRNALYTYNDFIAAVAAFPTFANAGTLDSCRKEAAAFLANVARETGSLRYAEQIAKSQYCSTRNSCVCDAATVDQTKWYYGRGPLQLSWNYNYCAAGAALGLDLLTSPNTVSTDHQVTWKTALWFWMTQRGAGTTTCHAAMTTGAGFGETIRTINGGVECNMGGYGVNDGVTERVNHYIDFATRLGVTSPGTPQDNDC